MACAVTKKARGKRRCYVRTTMTPDEHRDLCVAVQIACCELSKATHAGPKALLARLQVVYDGLWNPGEPE